MKSCARDVGAPLEVLRLDEPHLREAYRASVFLLRPDSYIAWRDDGPPAGELFRNMMTHTERVASSVQTDEARTL
jgi:hypothetical protein